ncbi:MAG: hypothetical protein MMC23_005197 [Stictis urceolatum]|nr:hypothetical protein [Stictis urceolata]
MTKTKKDKLHPDDTIARMLAKLTVLRLAVVESAKVGEIMKNRDGYWRLKKLYKKYRPEDDFDEGIFEAMEIIEAPGQGIRTQTKEDSGPLYNLEEAKIVIDKRDKGKKILCGWEIGDGPDILRWAEIRKLVLGEAWGEWEEEEEWESLAEKPEKEGLVGKALANPVKEWKVQDLESHQPLPARQMDTREWEDVSRIAEEGKLVKKLRRY